MREIIQALKSADNEATAAPYWLIIDPEQLGLMWKDGEENIFASLDEENCKRIENLITSCITGPFFSRADADDYLKSRPYAFGDKAFVYCHSGHASRKYLTFCIGIGVGA